jgi:hypothetical protein
LPNQVFECDRFCGRDALLPGPIAVGDIDCPFCAAEDALLGIDDLSDELAGTRARPMVGDGDREDAMRDVAAGDGAPASVNGAYAPARAMRSSRNERGRRSFSRTLPPRVCMPVLQVCCRVWGEWQLLSDRRTGSFHKLAEKSKNIFVVRNRCLLAGSYS